MTVLDVLALGFVLIGSKLLMAAIALYWLLPRDLRCETCDAELVALRAWPGTAGLCRLLRVQRRWCMECRRECIGRRLAVHAPPRPRSTTVRSASARPR